VVVANSFWKDGRLPVALQKPFDLIFEKGWKAREADAADAAAGVVKADFENWRMMANRRAALRVNSRSVNLVSPPLVETPVSTSSVSFKLAGSRGHFSNSHGRKASARSDSGLTARLQNPGTRRSDFHCLRHAV
jgi:hypothetical protein